MTARRETNTVVCVGTAEGCATTPDGAGLTPVESTTTEYVAGSFDNYTRTDSRGVVTTVATVPRWERLGYDWQCIGDIRCETVTNDGFEVSRTTTATAFNGPTTVRREWGVTNWTGEARFTDYGLSGHRLDYVVTESSDNGVVTNSVSEYDPLGRLVATTRPGANGALLVT